MKKSYNLKLHRVLIDELILEREIDNTLKTRIFLKGLEESITELGVLMPLLVVQNPGEYKFTLIDGYKRLHVLRKLNKNLLAVNVLIAEGSQENMSFSVNHVRGELSKLYQALYLHNILLKEKITQDEIARRFMLSKGEISKLLSVAKQPSLVKMVTSGMTMTSAKNLAISISSLTPEAKEKQINNIKNSVPYSELSTRKFEKITSLMSSYIDKVREPVDTRKLRRIYEYVDKHENLLNTDKIINSLIENIPVENPQVSPKRVVNAFKSICENIDPKFFNFDMNNTTGTVTLKLKMSPEEFRKFRRMLARSTITPDFDSADLVH